VHLRESFLEGPQRAEIPGRALPENNRMKKTQT
jgi:hypothetical protein